MNFKYLKKEIRWFWKTELNRRKTQEKEESEEKVLALKAREKKWRNRTSKFFKDNCNKYCKYGHIVSDCWENNNKTDNRNDNKTSRKTCFNGEFKNCGKRGHKAVYCWSKKGKKKDDDISNLFVGATFCG